MQYYNIKKEIRDNMQRMSLDFICRNIEYSSVKIVRDAIELRIIPLYTFIIKKAIIDKDVYWGGELYINREIKKEDLDNIKNSTLKSLYNIEYSNHKSNCYRVFVNKCDYYLGTFWWKGLRRIFHYNNWGVGVNGLTSK